MRSSNAAPAFKIAECLRNSLKLLNESKIRVGRIISDAAGYNKELMEMIDAMGMKFNLRFSYKKNFLVFTKALKDCTSWRRTEIETANFFWDCEVADIDYTMYKSIREFRVVTVRIPTEQTRQRIQCKEESERVAMIREKMKTLSRKKALKEIGKPYHDKNWKTIGDYQYKFYITNDFERTSEEIILEYNKRGNAERKFTFMKNDFAWDLPPFMEMNHNTVFLIAAALANNIFRGVVELFKDKIPGIKLNHRLPEFIARFIEVSCDYIIDEFVFYSEDVLYEELMI